MWVDSNFAYFPEIFHSLGHTSVGRVRETFRGTREEDAVITFRIVLTFVIIGATSVEVVHSVSGTDCVCQICGEYKRWNGHALYTIKSCVLLIVDPSMYDWAVVVNCVFRI